MTSRQAYAGGFGGVLLVFVPVMVLAAGTDEQAAGLIRALAPDYHPWCSALFSAPKGVEPWLFALQAVLGLAGLAACFMLLRRRSRVRRGDARHAD